MISQKLVAPETEDEIKVHWKYTDKVYISCVCTTFNQVKYIQDTIDSMLAQKCEFRFEIIIHDDLSTDGTRNILQSYRDKYPSIIKLVLQEENQFSKGKKITPLAIEYACGDYIALCEGDDFWICEDKLQKQVTVLVKNHGMVYTKAIISNASGTKSKKNILGSKIGDGIYIKNPIATLTVMIEKKILLEFYQTYTYKFNEWKMLDYPTWLFVYNNYKIHYIDEVSSCYRVFNASVSRSLDNKKQYLYRLSSYNVAKYFYEKKRKSFKFILFELYHNMFLAAWCKKRGLKEYKNHTKVMNEISGLPFLNVFANLLLKVIR
ncbi:glycosyltransferase [Pseudoalteromonas sp. SWXJZ94C]|uniref:glycosyltransferase n=1 Tax=Pseudoalteromonas sp. SWXJZ94C TaxID=2792065 RepID=UPI0018CE4AC6|nr:glycosyltransferase [Pseudoalteromonas sp. SWXJZ94C]MBH0057938.1 glycosyltransferase [Pseudoalteromonas sp. SWXJZ94C]